MICVDTNVIIRLLTQDDNKQYQKALVLFKSPQIFIPDSVILETEWVLRFAYQFSSKEICHALNSLFGLNNVVLNNPNQMAKIINWYKKGLDFSDAMHLSSCQQYDKIYTFDKKFCNKAKNLTRCKVIAL
ncbi:MAG: type II toxin-antitoxin system VapC family toxin [Proteobacteria bacterium]|nr:type II toxin-antitoxin system VapC family toxin [Pseudomonadota bacterium]